MNKLLDWILGPRCPFCQSRKHKLKDCPSYKNWVTEPLDGL